MGWHGCILPAWQGLGVCVGCGMSPERPRDGEALQRDVLASLGWVMGQGGMGGVGGGVK